MTLKLDKSAVSPLAVTVDVRFEDKSRSYISPSWNKIMSRERERENG